MISSLNLFGKYEQPSAGGQILAIVFFTGVIYVTSVEASQLLLIYEKKNVKVVTSCLFNNNLLLK